MSETIRDRLYEQLAELTEYNQQLRSEVERLRVLLKHEVEVCRQARRDAARWQFIKNKAWGQERLQGIWGPVLSFDIRLPAVEVQGDACSAFVMAVDKTLNAKGTSDAK